MRVNCEGCKHRVRITPSGVKLFGRICRRCYLRKNGESRPIRSRVRKHRERIVKRSLSASQARSKSKRKG